MSMCRMVNILSNDGSEIRVAEIKKAYIENIITSASKCRQIDAVILFGSALEERCTENSDIDFAIISKYSVDKLSSLKSFANFVNAMYDCDAKQEYDRLYFKSFSEIEDKQEEVGVCRELLNKGKVIYRKVG